MSVNMLRPLVLVGLIAALAGCGFLPRNAVPPELSAQAAIPHMPEVRAWAGTTEPGHGARSCGLLRPGVLRGISGSGRRRRSLRASRALRRRSERRLWCGIPQRLVRHRQTTGVQDRHRRLDGRADGAVRLRRSVVRRVPAPVLYDHRVAQHLPDAFDHSAAPGGRIARRLGSARGADRAAHGCRAARAGRGRAPPGPAACTLAPWTSTRSVSSCGTWDSSRRAGVRKRWSCSAR